MEVGITCSYGGMLLQDQGDLVSAEKLYRRALAIHEQALGPSHKHVAKDCNNLGWLTQAKGDLAGAEELYRRALAIHEAALGPEHQDVGINCYNLGSLPECSKLTQLGASRSCADVAWRSLNLRQHRIQRIGRLCGRHDITWRHKGCDCQAQGLIARVSNHHAIHTDSVMIGNGLSQDSSIRLGINSKLI